MTKHSIRFRAILAFTPVLLCPLSGATFVGCTAKREAATIDYVTNHSKCALQDLNRSADQMLIDCAIPKDAKDIQDIIDIFVGAQAGAQKAGASLPKAEHMGDAGAR